MLRVFVSPLLLPHPSPCLSSMISTFYINPDNPDSPDKPPHMLTISDVISDVITLALLIRFDLYSASCLPPLSKWVSLSKNYYVEVHCGEHSDKSSEQAAKKHACNWLEVLPELRVTFPEDLTQVPDVFIYLVNNDCRFAFLRISMADLVHPPPS